MNGATFQVKSTAVGIFFAFEKLFDKKLITSVMPTDPPLSPVAVEEPEFEQAQNPYAMAVNLADIQTRCFTIPDD